MARYDSYARYDSGWYYDLDGIHLSSKKPRERKTAKNRTSKVEVEA